MINENNFPNFKSNFRDFKIDFIQSGKELKVVDENFKLFTDSRMFKALEKNLPNNIITGSSSLYLFGFLTRFPGDIDIVSEHKDKIKKLLRISPSSYDENEYYLGKIGFTHKKWFWQRSKLFLYDVFEFNDNEFIEYNGIKIEHPFSVIQRKIELVHEYGKYPAEKHFNDLNKIFNCIEDVSNFPF